MTSMEREEKEKVKKREKKLEDEETLQQATWVKYTFPIKHQVYLHHNFPSTFGMFQPPCGSNSLLELVPSFPFCHCPSVMFKGVETKRGGVSRYRLRRLELDQQDLRAAV